MKKTMKTVFREKDPVYDPTLFEGEGYVSIDNEDVYPIKVTSASGIYWYTKDGRVSEDTPKTLSFTPYELNVNQVRPNEEIKEGDICVFKPTNRFCHIGTVNIVKDKLGRIYECNGNSTRYDKGHCQKLSDFILENHPEIAREISNKVNEKVEVLTKEELDMIIGWYKEWVKGKTVYTGEPNAVLLEKIMLKKRREALIELTNMDDEEGN